MVVGEAQGRGGVRGGADPSPSWAVCRHITDNKTHLCAHGETVSNHDVVTDASRPGV